MRSYERNGITVDQCGECRGIFLDRGELEHLIEADARAHSSTPGPSTPTAARTAAPPGRTGPLGHDDRHDDDDYRHSGHSQQKKRKRSWVDELFD